jgi:hypothetical protein
MAKGSGILAFVGFHLDADWLFLQTFSAMMEAPHCRVVREIKSDLPAWPRLLRMSQ